ncbi:MAG: hypothetical protein K0R80_2154 [Clostridia bacterium]|nr:hypothetical protein [Clostridia bacterium]
MGGINIKAVTMFFLAVEFITFILISIIHLFRLLFDSFNNVLASYIETLAKNHIGSIKGTFDILGLWVSSFSTKKLPLKETMMHFWEYKITWVGLALIVLLILQNYSENRQEYY